jgi:hypothetical protein
MTNEKKSQFQNSDLNNLNRVRDYNKNLSSSSSSSSSQPQISAYRHLLQFKEVAGLTDQAEFVCPATAKEKYRGDNS